VFLYDNNLCRPLFELISSQFVNVDDIDFFLVNSFDELEVEVILNFRVLLFIVFFLIICKMQSK
jgi:hypothetical protein